jgi:peptidoglycan-N-acetylglucosamine deacetylase
MKRDVLVTVVIMLFVPITLISPKVLIWLAEPDKPQIIGKAVSHITTSQKKVVLTFDDGPNPPYTDSILRVLKKHNIKAHFFVVGRYAQAFPSIFRKIVNDGHLIGNHTWSHKDLIFKTPGYVAKEIDKTDSIIRALGYNGEILFRSPRGRKLLILPYILAKTNRPNILFDAVAEDWRDISFEDMLHNVCDHVRPGSIILLHDGDGDTPGSNRSLTIKLTEAIIDTLINMGYQFVTVGELMDIDGK